MRDDHGLLLEVRVARSSRRDHTNLRTDIHILYSVYKARTPSQHKGDPLAVQVVMFLWVYGRFVEFDPVHP